ncbi:MAG: AAA family ATPase [Dehalococcoidia bacterium]
MDTLIMENFRCFAGRWEIPLAPLTLLVGENSSGKTSFLAAVRAAWDAVQEPMVGRLPVNEVPFKLGAFDQLVYDPPESKSDKPTWFSLGTTLPAHAVGARQRALPGMEPPRIGSISVEKRFIGREGVPAENETVVRGTESLSGQTARLIVGSDEDSFRLQLTFGRDSWERHDPRVYYGLRRWGRLIDRGLDDEGVWPGLPANLVDIAGILASNVSRVAPEGTRPYAFGPVRSNPERTYDPLRADLEDEGQRAALRLAEAFTRARLDDGLIHRLESFGNESGMFDSIDVRLFGGRADPFQVNFSVRDAVRNLVDLGYGVSQVLPILVELLLPSDQSLRRGGRTHTYLIQQPEVHLHPRAQAALASLFSKLSNQHRQILVETHSDYIIDRIRMDVRDGLGAAPSDVSLLFFEPTGKGTKIHRLRFTNAGDVVGVGPDGEDTDVPEGYRSFFLRESYRSAFGPD